MYDIILNAMHDIIHDIILYIGVAIVPLQLMILSRPSALMQTMVGMSVMLTWTDQWISTR